MARRSEFARRDLARRADRLPVAAGATRDVALRLVHQGEGDCEVWMHGEDPDPAQV